MTSSPVDDGQIREAAYYLWLDAGRPEGRALEHWQQASDALAATKAKPARKAAKPKAAAKPKSAAKPKATTTTKKPRASKLAKPAGI